jgi:uncharacterized membrane protein YozB (DUF420 family)
MAIPMWSVVTLVTELGVSAAVFYVIWKGYKEGRFIRPLAFGVLAYEVLFNISYMLSRSLRHAAEKPAMEKPGEIGLAIFHGTFSLVMFVALIIFFFVAASRYARGENFFLAHRRLTLVFLSAWIVSVLSGVAFFILLYLL